MKESRIIIHNGVLYRGVMVDCPEADRIAQANGFMYVESMIKKFENGTELVLNYKNEIKRTIPLE